MTKTRTISIIIICLILGALFGATAQSAAQTGTTNSMSSWGIEATNGNFTNFYLSDVLMDTRLGGNWLGVPITTDTLDTGQGANDLFDMDQNVLTSSDVEFNTVTTTNVDSTTPTTGWTTYLGFNSARENSSNYFYCTGSSDGAQVQAAFNQVQTSGGSLYVEEGVYDIDDQSVNITNANHESIRVQGEGWGANEWDLKSGDGSVFYFTAPYGFLDWDDQGTAFGALDLNDIGLQFSGNYTGSYRPLQIRLHVLNWRNVHIQLDGHIPTSSTAYIFGSTGPPAEHWTYKNVQFIDERKTGNFSYLARFYGEEILLDGCSLITNINKTFPVGGGNYAPVSDMRLFRSTSVSHTLVKDFMIFTGTLFDTHGSQYEYQWYNGESADAHWRFESSQWFEAVDVRHGHLATNNGDVYVSGYYPHIHEGGTVPMAIVITQGAGTIYLDMDGVGYSVSGSATIPNNEDSIAVTHGLVGTPTYIVATGTTADTNQLIATTIGATTFNVTAVGNVGGARTVYYEARYNPTG